MAKPKWNDVGAEAGHAGDHCAFTDADELMRSRMTAHEYIILNDNMAAEDRVVGHCDVVADLAIVADMRCRP